MGEQLSLFADVGADISAFRRAMSVIPTVVKEATKRAMRALDRMSKSLDSIGKSLSLKVTAPLTILGGLAIRTFTNFQRELNFVRGVLLATADDIAVTEGHVAELKDTIAELGLTTRFTAREVSQGAKFLAIAGNQALEIVEALPGTLRLATAAQLDLASSADIVTNVMAGFGKEGDELNDSIDVMVAGFTGANISLTDLGQSFKFVGPQARSAGIDFEEVVSVLGALGNAGIQGGQAGRILRQVLLRLARAAGDLGNKSNDATKSLQQFGLESVVAEGRISSLADVIRQIEQFDLGSTAAISALANLFGTRQVSAIQALALQGADSIQEMTDKLLEIGEVAQKIESIQMEGLQGRLVELQSAWTELNRRIVEANEEGLNKISVTLTKVIRMIGNFNETALQTIGITGSLAAALGPVLIGVSQLVIGIKLVAPALSIMGTVLAGIVPILATVGAGWIALELIQRNSVEGQLESLNELNNEASRVADEINQRFRELEEEAASFDFAGGGSTLPDKRLRDLRRQLQVIRQRRRELEQELANNPEVKRIRALREQQEKLNRAAKETEELVKKNEEAIEKLGLSGVQNLEDINDQVEALIDNLRSQATNFQAQLLEATEGSRAALIFKLNQDIAKLTEELTEAFAEQGEITEFAQGRIDAFTISLNKERDAVIAAFDALEKRNRELERSAELLEKATAAQEARDEAAIKAAEAVADINEKQKDLQKEIENILIRRSMLQKGATEDEIDQALQIKKINEEAREEIAELNLTLERTGAAAPAMTEKVKKAIANIEFIRDHQVQQVKNKFSDMSKFIQEVGEQMARNIQNTVADVLFNTLTGQFTSFEDFIRGWGHSVVRIISDMAARLLIELIGIETFFEHLKTIIRQSTSIGDFFDRFIDLVLGNVTPSATQQQTQQPTVGQGTVLAPTTPGIPNIPGGAGAGAGSAAVQCCQQTQQVIQQTIGQQTAQQGSIWDRITDSIGGWFSDLFTNIKSAWDSAVSAISGFFQNQTQILGRGINSVVQGIQNLTSLGLAQLDFQKQQANFNKIQGVLGAAQSASSSAAIAGSLLKKPKAAKGGVSTRPTLISENFQTEAAVPLPDNRSIPVTFTNPNMFRDRSQPTVIELTVINRIDRQTLFEDEDDRMTRIVAKGFRDDTIIRREVRREMES